MSTTRSYGGGGVMPSTGGRREGGLADYPVGSGSVYMEADNPDELYERSVAA